MQVFVCEACGRRTITLNETDVSCWSCGRTAGGVVATKLSITLDHSDFHELEVETLQPREDLESVET